MERARLVPGASGALHHCVPHPLSRLCRGSHRAQRRAVLAADAAPARAVLVSTPTLGAELEQRGLPQWRLWTRGIDHDLFRPGHAPLPQLGSYPGPVLLYVGRIAPEKNLPLFLDAAVPGHKVVVGDGPDLEALRKRYPEVTFLGALTGEALARAYCSADVFVFPSRTDTFGLVLIEALACGLPVAALPVPGPLDIIGVNGGGPNDDLPMTIGALDEDLAQAIRKALRLDGLAAAVVGAGYSWERATDQFLTALQDAALTPAAASPQRPRTKAAA